MQWYYVDDGQQAGPVEETEFPSLLNLGKVRPDTLIWREGMTNWETFSTAAPPEYRTAVAPLPLGSPAPGTEAVCAECGGSFHRDDMITHGNLHICANCKPVFMQKLAEGVKLPRAGLGNLVTEQQVLEREYRIEIGSALTRSWESFKQNAGSSIGTAVVIGFLFFAGWVVGVVVSMVVPFANAVLGVLYTAPLTAGLLWFMLRIGRGEQATVADGLAGFRTRYLQFVLFGVIQFLCMVVCLLPVMAVALGFGLTAGFARGNAAAGMAAGLVSIFVILVVLAVCAMIYVNTLLVYSLLLMVDKGYPCWPAIQLSRKMAQRRWWMTFLFLFVNQILTGVGFLICLVGGLVTVPVGFGMKAALYDENFRDLRPFA